jgi:AcrR family transcriptional regulator
MVATPWGESETLRERKLAPARGTPAEAVRQSQRERIFAALTACVAEKGFAATSMADLLELSGVSSRTFYDHFADKAACLEATVAEIVAVVERTVFGLEVDEGDMDLHGVRNYQAFAAVVAWQPAATKVCLIDAPLAGLRAFEPVLRALRRYDEVMARRFAAHPRRAGMPAQLIAARMGGLLEIVRARLRRGAESELLNLGEDFVGFVLADLPPPEPLRLAGRAPRVGTEDIEAADHAERAIRAFAVLVCERGYEKVRVEDVLRRASMSASTFYANFRGKEDLMGAAIEGVCAQAVAAVGPAFARREDWPGAVRAGFGALLNFLASRPALAHLVTVDVYAAGDFAIARRAEGLAPLRALVEDHTSHRSVAPVVHEALAGGTFWLLFEEVSRGGVKVLPGLAPICTYAVLLPFIGAEQAQLAANGDGSARGGEVGGRGAPSVPASPPARFGTTIRGTVLRLMVAVAEGEARAAAEIAAEIHEEPGLVDDYLGELARIGLLDALEPGEPGGEVRYRYPHRSPVPGRAPVGEPAVEEREAITARSWEEMREDVEESIARHSFDARALRTIARARLRVDERGWLELAGLHEQMLHATIEIHLRSRQRMRDSGERGLEARSLQLAFEMPEGEAGEGGEAAPAAE